jgi:TRAP-type C4-dicarboxylate transport system substrate-binding protein
LKTWLGFLALCAAVAFFTLGEPRLARAEPIRLGILTPWGPGTASMKVLERAAVDVEKKTAGRIALKYQSSGSPADERDAVRKLQLGQVDGADLTAVGLSAIDSSIRVLELPGMFQSVQELDYVADKLWPHFQEKFEAKGFKLAERGEVGWTYFFTKTDIQTLDDLKSQKLYLGTDDPIALALYKKLALNVVPLNVGEVALALMAGKITGCYGTPVTALALQWPNTVKFMPSLSLGYGIGATVISGAAYSKLADNDAKILATTTRAAQKKLRTATRKANEDAKLALRSKGVTLSQTPTATVTAFGQQATALWNEQAGKLYSKEELQMVLDAREEYRAKRKR